MIVNSAFSALSARVFPSFSLPNFSAFSAFSARVFPSFSLLIRVFRVFRCSIKESLLFIGYRLLKSGNYLQKKFTPNLLVNLLRIY